MASNDLYQSDEIAPNVKELLQKFDNLQQRIDQERIQKKSSNNRELMGIDSNPRNRAAFQAENDAIASLEAEKLHVWEKLRRLDPVLAGEIKVDAPNFAQIQQLIDEPTTAILSFYTTTNDLQLFILRQNKLTLHTGKVTIVNTIQSLSKLRRKKNLQMNIPSHTPDSGRHLPAKAYAEFVSPCR